MKALKNIVGIFLVVFLLFSLLKNIFNYKDKIKFYENYKQNFEEEKKKNIELKTEIVKKKSTAEVEKTIRNDLNLLKPDEIAIITGQKPVVTKARKSIANFKLREGVPIGVMVTLRRDRMYHFLDKLIAIALPRVRDFKGVSPRGFDGRGNYTLGIKEQIMFPEVNYDKIDKIRGMNITIVTTARTDEEGLELLRLMGMPFRA